MPLVHEILVYFFAVLMTLAAMYIWTRLCLHYYFETRRKHNLKLVRELKEENRKWP